MKAIKAQTLRITTNILHNWNNHVSERQMTLILAFLIGFFASVAAFILHSIISSSWTWPTIKQWDSVRMAYMRISLEMAWTMFSTNFGP